MIEKIKTKQLFDLTKTIAKNFLKKEEFPHTAIPKIAEYISILQTNLPPEFQEISLGVFCHITAKVSQNAKIYPPAIICKNAEIRDFCKLRSGVIVGENAVCGSFCEIKNAILFDCACIPHLNYVGDSILGFKAHIGAGVILSNLRQDGGEVIIKSGSFALHTHLRKMGSMLGDYAEIGCGTVLNPGTIVGRNAVVLPQSNVREIIPENSLYKPSGEISPRKQRQIHREFSAF